MKIGRVIGKVWAERKVPQLKGCRLQVIQPLSSDGKRISNPIVAADPKNIAGVNDIVVYVTSTDASQAFESGFAPVNASVVELVDTID
jgi:ethanolamine utilization protein EutN